MGMVPNLATGVWVGGEDRSVHFKQITFGQAICDLFTKTQILEFLKMNF